MSKFSNYLSLYESTDPPPIITEGYKEVQDRYNKYLGSDTVSEEQATQTSSPSNSVEEFRNKFLKSLQESSKSLSGYFGNSNLSSSTQSTAQQVVDLARQFVGTKYKWGGMTPSTGFDHSGLVQYVYKQSGINLPREIKDIEKTGTEVSIDDVQKGDLICTTGASPIKIVSKVQDGQIYTIEAKGKKDGIIESTLNDTSNITSIRRVINQGSSNYIIKYFLDKGLTLNQAKGIYGNIMQESSGNINARSVDGHNSYGLAQWTGSRKQKLFSLYGPNPTARQQLDFMWWELNNTHKGALESLRKTNTVADSTRVFMDQFERPHKDYANFNKRLQYANSIT